MQNADIRYCGRISVCSVQCAGRQYSFLLSALAFGSPVASVGGGG